MAAPVPPPPPPPPSPPLSSDAAELADRAERRLVAIIQAAHAEGSLSSPAARDAWSKLVEQYQHRLMAVCIRMVGGPNDPAARERATDLTQDAFVKIITHLHTWEGRGKLSTWMIGVTMRVCLTHLRAAKHRRHASLDQPNQNPSIAHSTDSASASLPQSRELNPDSRVEHQDQRRRVLVALAELDPDQRSILILRDIQGLDYEQISPVLGIPLGTVKSRLFRARLALRALLESSEASDHGHDHTHDQ